jgi:RNA polymerase sigma factor (sigma-70 family)
MPNADAPGLTPSDEQLAGRARAGDRMAFNRLMQRHAPRLVNFLERQLGSRSDADDVAQNTFIAIHRNLHRFDETRAFVTWMFVIARNKAKDHHRRRAVRNWIGLEEPSAPAPVDPTTPERIVSDRDELARVNTAIQAMPEGLRTPLLLSVIDGMSHAEIGSVMGLSEKAAEVRVYRARRRLRDSFPPEG